MRRRIRPTTLISLVLLISLEATGVLPLGKAFSGQGTRAYHTGRAYLNPSSRDGSYLREPERSRVLSMSDEERYEQAVDHFRRALRGNPSQSERSRIENVLTLSLNRLSLAYAANQRWSDAAYAAEQATRYNPDDPILRFNHASYLRSAGRNDDAIWTLERALEQVRRQEGTEAITRRIRSELIDALTRRAVSSDGRDMNRVLHLLDDALFETPDDPDLLRRRALAYYTLGDLDRAIVDWEQIKSRGTLDATQAAMLNEARSRVQSMRHRGTYSVERSGFTLTYDIAFATPGGDEDRPLYERILDDLMDARDSLRSTYGVRHGSGLLNVYLHRRAEFDQIHGNRPIAGSHWHNRIDLRVDPEEDPSTIRDYVFHEFSHHLTRIRAGERPVPGWFNEGLAQYFEPGRNMLASVRRGVALYRAELQLSFASIERIQQLPPQHFHAAYVQSFFQVHWLIERHGIERVLSVLDQLKEGISFANAFSAVFSVELGDFERQWRSNFRDHLRNLRDRHLPQHESES